MLNTQCLREPTLINWQQHRPNRLVTFFSTKLYSLGQMWFTIAKYFSGILINRGIVISGCSRSGWDPLKLDKLNVGTNFIVYRIDTIISYIHYFFANS